MIVEKWLNDGLRFFEIAQQLSINRQTVANIVDHLKTGNMQPEVGGNRLRTARTDDV